MAGIHITSEDYAHPYRPWPVAAFNWLGHAFGVDRALPDAETLMAIAQKRTGLDDFGDEALLEPLKKLVFAINQEAALTAMGRVASRGRIIGLLVQRLRAEAAFKRHPEILETKISSPVFIVGLQRTGTTILQRLLAVDPQLRSLMSYEAVSPVPLPKRFWHRRDPRISKARLAQRSLMYFSPDFFAVHPVDAVSPEEEVLLLDYTFLSTVPEAMHNVPSFSTWLETQDQTPAYLYLKKLLKLLSWQAPADRWILKTPHHLEWLDTLFEVFPDAKVVQTHRDPKKTVASLCSLIGHIRGVCSDRVDPFEIGREWSRKVERMVNRGMESRDRIGEDRFLDISYYDLVGDPIGQIAQVYDYIEQPFTGEARERIAKALAKNEKGKFGVHKYKMEDFGLNEVGLEKAFSKYRNRFNIPHEE